MQNTVIQIENSYSWLHTHDKGVRQKLWKALRFPEKGYFHSRLYKQKLWDGYVEFFKKESGRFLTGLLPEVEAALKYMGAEYQIVDERNVVDFRFSKIDDQFLNQWLPSSENSFPLYDYQVDLTNSILKNKRGVICSPTASGKTAIMISILKSLPQNCPTLILANRKSLVEQNYDEMMKWGFENVGRMYDKYKEPNIFTCSTVQSLHKMKPVLGKIRALIVDEIHENMSKVPKKFFGQMKSCSIRVAVSATPFKFGGKDKVQKYSVKGYFGPIMRSTSMDGILTTNKLQKRDILSSSKCIFFPIREPDLPYEIYLDAVTRGIAENFHFHEVVKKLVSKLKGRTLILVERIAHGDTLASMIPDALWVQGKDDLETRKHVIEQLKKSKKKTVAIATQGIFNAGVNFMTHNLINAAGGKAEHQIIQRIGRGLRTAGDKEQLNYYDFVFEINDYLFDHSRKRIKILKKEGHDLEIKNEIDF